MKLKHALAAIVLVLHFAAPVAAEDAVDAYRRGDYLTALRLIRPLANDDEAAAQFNLGLMYLTGKGVQRDDAAAGIWFRKAAEQGYALAQSNLGVMYRDGRGVPQNYTDAVMWFRKAADQGDAVAQYLLGDQYANGAGVSQDYTEAMIWFRKAAEQGHPMARLYLGVMYAEGRGVTQDFVRAHMWFDLSAAQGEQKAAKALDMAERRMTPAQIAEAQLAASFIRPAMTAQRGRVVPSNLRGPPITPPSNGSLAMPRGPGR
jgi:TPR repeat protein